MAKLRRTQVKNSLLSRLPARESQALISRCDTVELPFGTIVCEGGQKFTNVWFPLGGFVSVVVVIDAHPPLEMGMIGNEGVVGASLLLGLRDVGLSCRVQGHGEFLRMSAVQFERELAASTALRLIVGRYLFVLSVQLSRLSGCTHFHEVDARLARWLLMTHDRSHADHFHLTHQFLGDMLGVRRSGISTAAAIMQAQGMIEYSRGDIRVLDRAALETMACSCYSAVIKEYRRVFPGLPRAAPG